MASWVLQTWHLRLRIKTQREDYLRKIKSSGELLADLVNDTLETEPD
jgi:hypothetical protein